VTEPLDSRRNSTAASAALYDRALKVMPGGNTRLTYVMQPFAPYAARGAGALVHDVDGNAYLDFGNNFFSLIHGHAHPAILSAIAEAMTRGTSFGLPTEAEVLLAEEICGRSPALQQIRFVNSGTEAMLTAVKAARAFTGRPKIAKMEGAYHGGYDHTEVSLDPTPANWGEGEPASVPYDIGTPQAVLDDTLVLPFNDIETTGRLIERHAKDLAAIILDPMPSRIGLVAGHPDYLARLQAMARRHGILLLVDEIITFRLAPGGAHSIMGIAPDLVTLGKVIGGGLPVGAVAGRAEVMDVFNWRNGKPRVSASGTFSANPLSMAAGLASMRLLTPRAYARLEALGDRLRAGVGAVFRDLGLPGQALGAGSLFRIHLHDRPIRDYRSAYPTEAEKARVAALHRQLLDRGVLVTANLSGALSTPMGEGEVDAFLAIFRDALEAVAGQR